MDLFSWLSADTGQIDEFLPVPFDYQTEKEDECFVYCLWMANNYFKNKHPNESLRRETNVLSPDELLDDLTIVKGGWKPDQDELTVISNKIKTLDISLNYWQDGSPRELKDIIKENIDDGYPVIPFIVGQQLRKSFREDDGAHAVVVAGYGDDYIALHDPMGYPEDTISYSKLDDAWDPMFNQIVTISLSKRGSKLAGGSE